jgi:alanine racemase
LTRRIDHALAAAGLPALERSAWVEVNIAVLSNNARVLRAMVRPLGIAPVVKADGYGHGLEMAGRCAVTGGARWLGVADAAEAFRLRQDGYQGRVLVLYPIPPSIVAEVAFNRVDVTVGSLEDIRMLPIEPGLPPLAVHLEIDTGMTRGGVNPRVAVEATTLIAEKSARLAGVWTHLSAPEDAATTNEQLSVFDLVLGELDTAGIEPGDIHVSASGGLLASASNGHDLVRPGLAFYGLHPGAGDSLPETVTPALSVKAHAVRVAEVTAGTTVGYAGTWTADRDSIIATLPIGYADGWSRSSSPGTRVLVEGQSASVVGRVSSDSLTVDVTDVEGVGHHSEFTLLGRAAGGEITADEVAEVRGTISWEVLQQLGARLSRVYTSGSAIVAIRGESTTRVVAAHGTLLPDYSTQPDRSVR